MSALIPGVYGEYAFLAGFGRLRLGLKGPYQEQRPLRVHPPRRAFRLCSLYMSKSVDPLFIEDATVSPTSSALTSAQPMSCKETVRSAKPPSPPSIR